MPVDAGVVWFLGSVVAPDAWTRTLNYIRSRRGEYRRLTQAVQEQTGLKVGRGYKRWFMRDDVWRDLVSDTEAELPGLILALEEELRAPGLLKRRRSSDELRSDAEKLVNATLLTLLQSLDPARAIAIAEDRIRKDIGRLQKAVELREDLESKLVRLPPPTRGPIRDLYVREPAIAARVVDIYESSEQPLVSFRGLLEVPPPWIDEAGPHLLLVLAQILRSHGESLMSAQVFERIADAGLERDRNLALAAHGYFAGDLEERAHAAISKARAVAGRNEGFVEIVAALIDSDAERVVALAENVIDVDVEIAGAVLSAIVSTKGAKSAVDLCRSLILKYTDYASFRVMLVRLVMARAHSDGAALSAREKSELINYALEARDIRRVWRGDSGEPAILAVELSMSQLNFERALRLGRTAPDGEALASEADAPGMKKLMAEAALAAGLPEIAAQEIAGVVEPFEVKFLHAERALLDASDREAAVALYREAWDLCRDDADRLATLHCLAALGAELPEKEKLNAYGEIQEALILAQHQAATGDIAGAIARLRELRNRSPHVVQLLVHLYGRTQDVDSAVTVLQSAASHFDHPKFTADAAGILFNANRLSEAENLAVSALVSIGDDPQARIAMHEILITSAMDRHAWRQMESRVRALIEEYGAKPQYRWLLAGALYNQREYSRSWDVVSSAPKLEPDTMSRARVWVDLNCQFRTDAGLASEIFALLDTYPDVDEFAGPVLAAYMKWSLAVELPNSVREVGQRRVDDFVANNPNHRSLWVISLPDNLTPEEVVATFKPILAPGTSELYALIQTVGEGGLPYGFISAYSGKPHALVHVLQGAGCTLINSVDESIVAAELEAARQVKDGRVVLETSTLAVAYHIRDSWTQLKRYFEALVLPLPAKADMAEAIRFLASGSSGSLGWDPVNDKFTMSETQEEDSQRVVAQAQWMLDETRDFDIPDWPSVVKLTAIFGDHDGGEDRFVAWLASIDYAAYHDLPLLTDDRALRDLARMVGVKTFGTTALLAVLAESGVIPDDVYTSTLIQLRYHRCVDFPLNAFQVNEVAVRDDWAPGSAAFSFSRSSAWNDPIAFKLWSLLAKRAYERDGNYLPGWLYYAIKGCVKAKQSAHALAASVALLSAATFIAAGRPDTFVQLLACTRDALVRQDVSDVLPAFVVAIKDYAEPTQGAHMAARIVLEITRDLNENDKAVVRETLFAPK